MKFFYNVPIAPLFCSPETAAILGVSENVVSVRLSRARGMLYTDLAGSFPELVRDAEHQAITEAQIMNKTLDSKIDELLAHLCGSAVLNEPDKAFSYAVMHKIQDRKATRPNIFRLRPAIIAFAAVAIAIIVAPFAGNMVQALSSYFKFFLLGDRTTMVQFEPLPKGERTGQLEAVSVTSDPNGATVGERRRAVKNGMRSWRLDTSFGTFEGEVLEEDYIPPATFYFFEDAAKQIGRLKKPDYLPGGYFLDKIKVVSPNDAFLFYKGDEGPILIHQALVGGGKTLSATTSEIEFLKVSGNNAVWLVRDRHLKWQSGNTSYGIAGEGLSKETALKMAESLK